MKANAPENIHILPTHDRWFEGNIPKGLPNGLFVEYTKKDAFVEKAVEYILTHIPDMHILGDSAKMDECIVKEFINYMKGE